MRVGPRGRWEAVFAIKTVIADYPGGVDKRVMAEVMVSSVRRG